MPEKALKRHLLKEGRRFIYDFRTLSRTSKSSLASQTIDSHESLAHTFDLLVNIDLIVLWYQGKGYCGRRQNPKEQDAWLFFAQRFGAERGRIISFAKDNDHDKFKDAQEYHSGRGDDDGLLFCFLEAVV